MPKADVYFEFPQEELQACFINALTQVLKACQVSAILGDTYGNSQLSSHFDRKALTIDLAARKWAETKASIDLLDNCQPAPVIADKAFLNIADRITALRDSPNWQFATDATEVSNAIDDLLNKLLKIKEQ